METTLMAYMNPNEINFNPSCVLECCKCNTKCYNICKSCTGCGCPFIKEGLDFITHNIEIPEQTFTCGSCGFHNGNVETCKQCGAIILAQSSQLHVSRDLFEPTATVNPAITLQEHPRDGGPVSYMAIGNLKNMKHDLDELMYMLNLCDELPQWVSQSISEAADRISKAKRYVFSRKDI